MPVGLSLHGLLSVSLVIRPIRDIALGIQGLGIISVSTVTPPRRHEPEQNKFEETNVALRDNIRSQSSLCTQTAETGGTPVFSMALRANR